MNPSLSQIKAPAIDLNEMVRLGAVDGVFFSRAFFPRTCRQSTPPHHTRVWTVLDDPTARLSSFLIFRDGAKTTLCRIFTARRIAYGLSRTILYVGKSESHAARSVEWILKQVQFNTLFAQTFGLTQGSKWTGQEVEIINTKLGISTRVLAVGITGSIRGINVDDYRPDLIIGDDITDDENASTPEQRGKIIDLWTGTLQNSLAPASECPDAKQILLGTPIDNDDVNMVCYSDPAYRSLRCSVLDNENRSSWPERWDTTTVLAEKETYIRRNQLSVWLREKECQIVSRERAAFNIDNLKYWDILPDDLTCVLVIDPVPPRTNVQMQKARDTDYEVLAVVARYKNRVFVPEIVSNRGHTPEWTVMQFFRLAQRWKPRKAIVETTGYQKTLSWLLQSAMKARGMYVQIDERDDRRSKRDRILQGLQGLIANQELYIHRDMTSLRAQIEAYPAVPHDDEIEVVAVGAEALMTDDTLLGTDYYQTLGVEKDIEALPKSWRGCP